MEDLPSVFLLVDSLVVKTRIIEDSEGGGQTPAVRQSDLHPIWQEHQ